MVVEGLWIYHRNNVLPGRTRSGMHYLVINLLSFALCQYHDSELSFARGSSETDLFEKGLVGLLHIVFRRI